MSAVGGFVPPTWADTGVLLRGGLALWLALAAAAGARAGAAAAFGSRAFRGPLRRARAAPRARPPPAVVAFRLWRAARRAVVRFHWPEPAVARYFGLPRFCGAVVVCVLYIVESYLQGIPSHYYWFQAVYGVAVGVKLVLGFVYSARPVYYLFSLSTMVDCLSVPSLLLSSGRQWLNYNFLQAYSGVLIEWALLEKYDIVLMNYPTLARLLVNLVLQLLVFLFITSCGIQQFELLGDPGEQLASETFQITWANSVYFAVVTLMTVGYGDFVPYTLLGRMWIVFHIILAAYLVSREISLLIDALKSMRRGGGSFVKSAGDTHVVVTGHIKWQFLVQFVKEFLVEREHLDVKIVVLTVNEEEWTDEDWNKYVQSSPFLDYHLIFLEGSPLKPEDLARARVEAASGVFVLSDPHRKDPYLEDSDTLKALLTVRTYASEVPIYTINALHDSSFQFKIAMEQVHPDDTAWLSNFANPTTTYDIARSRTYNTFMHLIPPTPASLIVDNADDGAALGAGPAAAGSQSLMDFVESADVAQASPLNHLASPENLISAQRDDMWSPIYGSPVNRDDMGSTTAADLGISSAALRNTGQRKRGATSCESVCMQKLEMALLAESVFCNGLSTFITNLAIRQHPKSRESDPPWLREYMLGSECGIRFCKIPADFRGRRVVDVAAPLYDYGLVMLAVRRSVDHNWRLVHTETILDSEMTAAVLTYHEGNVIDRIGEHANDFLRRRDERESREAATQANEDALFSDAEAASFGHQHRTGVAGAMHSMELDADTDELFQGLAEEDSPKELSRDGVFGGKSGGPAGRDRFDSPVLGEETKSGFTPQPLGTGPSPLSAALRRPPSRKTAGVVPPLAPLPISLASAVPDPPSESREGQQQKPARASSGSKSALPYHRPEGKAPRRKSSRGAASDDEDYGENDIDGGVCSTGVRLPLFKNRDPLPADLKGHIIVCVDGEHPLINLDYLLRRIWVKRDGEKMRSPVVVIHPKFPKNFEREVPRGKGRPDLYLLQGNSLSLETLTQAQFQRSCAILIMSSESGSAASRGSTDSKAIFTVMTLDSLLDETAPTFICCMLDAVDSLQLLLSPSRARRRGIGLGEHREHTTFYRDRSFRGSTSFHQLAQRSMSAASLTHRSVPSSPFVNLFSGAASPFNNGDNGYGSIPFAPTSVRENLTRAQSFGGGLRTPSGTVKRSESIMFGMDAANVPVEEDEEEEEEELPVGVGEANVAMLRKQQRRHVAKEESAEGQRFASGEMMISSFFAGLLVREYVDSGFVQLIREMIGTGAETQRSWIRQIDVPQRWADTNLGDGSGEGRTYREAVERLLVLGCIPLGLYRSGDAPVRMEHQPDDGDVPERASAQSSMAAPSEYDEISRTFSQLNDAGVPLLPGSYLSLRDEFLGLNDDAADMGRMYYDCPTTNRRIQYIEATSGGENALPYVYTNPEPYTVVSANDAVFVLCPPELAVSPTWEMRL